MKATPVKISVMTWMDVGSSIAPTRVAEVRWIEGSAERDRPCQQLRNLYVANAKSIVDAENVRTVVSVALHLGEVQDQRDHEDIYHLRVQVPGLRRKTGDSSDEELLQLIDARSNNTTQG
ncbi:uncharacterized protein IUM83_05776 [Phytophthora cinnamomi]|uniref:uncharacterized protein n=1 Tax=Phytophthora cinnamomi TaxID=4785 RepID=UPI003559CB2B|nr:hypothetical protein IUM83_05776 [Phytophthora cinnamomi]